MRIRQDLDSVIYVHGAAGVTVVLNPGDDVPAGVDVDKALTEPTTRKAPRGKTSKSL